MPLSGRSCPHSRCARCGGIKAGYATSLSNASTPTFGFGEEPEQDEACRFVSKVSARSATEMRQSRHAGPSGARSALY